jgi:hypothetical protein
VDDIEVSYLIASEDGTSLRFTLAIDALTVEMRPWGGTAYADWTRLPVHQCPHCPLSAEDHPFCPVAVNMERMIDTLGFLVSYEQVHLEIAFSGRMMVSTVPAQNAISSVLGLVIATSPCPHTAFLKPMARFHLPLAGLEETLYRVIGTYLIGEYYRTLDGKGAELNLNRLHKVYEGLEIMNGSLARRLKMAKLPSDAAINALIILNTYAQSVPFFVDHELKEMRPLFDQYLRSLDEPPSLTRNDR